MEIDASGHDGPPAESAPAPDAAASDSRWMSVPAKWFESDPRAERASSDFVDLCRHGSVRQIIDGLEAVWLLLDQAALWVSSIQTDLAASSTQLVDRTCAALMPTIPRQMRSLTFLGRTSLDHLPTAMAAARATFEAGLRLAWIRAPQDEQERKIRVLRLHNAQARWKGTVGADYDNIDAGGYRWRQAARVQAALVSRELGLIGWSEPLPRVAPVREQLRELDLDRLYPGYRLASEYVHGGLSGALEAEVIVAENSPFGNYWPNDWFLAVSMCAWGCLFLDRYAERAFNLGPTRGAALAAELMLLSPAPGWRQKE